MSALANASDSSVKDQIIQLLKLRGPQTAASLADQLGVSPMAIRQHLQVLREKQWVSYTEERQPVGRPVKRWELTAQTCHLFPNNHEDLAINLLQDVQQVFGEEGFAALLAERVQTQIRTYAEKLSAHHWRSRVGQIAQLRSQEGYMAEVIEQADESVLLVENHCSIHAAAQACSQFCAGELEVFQALLGDGITVERQEHILVGDRRCAYRISPHPSPTKEE
ncbi:MAG: HTH domain-containing protein [Synechococcales bacterium]|nr:HTH domain-containing protein [Synechococcales bacterium]